MNFLLSSELIEFRDSLRKFFVAHCPPSSLREGIGLNRGCARSWTAGDESSWKAIGELGVFIAMVPESGGGLGFGLAAAQIVLEEAARVLAPLPLFESIGMTVPLIDALFDDELKRELFALVGAADHRVSTALIGGGIQRDSEVSVVEHPSSGIFLTGELPFVPSASLVPLLFVFDLKLGVLFVVNLEMELGHTVRLVPAETLDLVRSYARVHLERTPALRFPIRPMASDCEVERVVALSAVSEMVGACDRVLEMTTEYVRTRRQFNRPVGSFQAIQHKLANVYLELEQVRALARFAVWAYDHDRAQFGKAALAAKGLAGKCLPHLCHEALQAHGGIGFTFEHDLHLYLRRVKTLSLLFGGTTHCLEELGREVLEEHL